ncbi:unnamed protein product (macronuclear) [Paramecium tetraurelia]|uniref:BZIP domain-containing protein n=1 Tax=Paramecium tetraurelia TaxID=5888 RepID=A0BLF0_PARTE|nr:uncharacterized protein GSPATT00030000001 [Paramecium tetraurelia]CAK59367.1 unnamed protein product [Paramecium tetraurelia]|eukprot:XP_001426765.1 hypothetical protein (macronuclear) [Paramecium tetraurelia strain d4-2]
MSNQLYKYFRSCEVNQNIVFFAQLDPSTQIHLEQQLPKIQIFEDVDQRTDQMSRVIQYENQRMDRLQIKNNSSFEGQPRSGSDGDNSRDGSQNDQRNQNKRKCTKKHQNKLNEQLQSEIIAQTNCIYSNKIQNLVKKDANNQLIVTKKIRQSRSQQKMERKNEQQLNVPVEHSDQSSSEIPDSINYGNLDPNRLKQVRNRESARNSRARKKIYYELLEIRVKDLQDENDKLRQQCNSLQKSIETYNRQQDKFQAFLNQQQKLFERLEECMTQGKDDTEIEILLDALKYRTSSNKQERIDAAKAHSYSILDVSLPLQAKYLFSILDDRDFFSQNQKNVSEFLRDILRNIEMKPENYINNERIKLKIGLSKQNITDSFKKIKEEIKAIQNEASKIDLLWEQLKENIKPNLLAQLLISLHQNEFRSEFQASAIFKKNKDKIDQNCMQIEVQQVLLRKQLKKSN